MSQKGGAPKPGAQKAGTSSQFPDAFDKNFDLGKELGRGATATVHECNHKGTKEKFAVKIINKNDKDIDKQTIKEEIGLLLTLKHSNIIMLKEVYESPKCIYMVLELATGGELFDRIVTKGYYSEKDAVMCVKDLLEAIKYLHDNNVVHRDLKPENLLYESTQDTSPLKLADFGLARVVTANVALNQVCGTPGYCAPEVLLGKNYHKPVDMFAVGVITYILASGYEPFTDPFNDTDQAMFKNILKCRYDFEGPEWTDISENLKDFIRKLLVLDPKGRMTADQALNHPWISRGAAKDTPMPKTQENLKKFNAKRKLKAAARMVGAAAMMKASLANESASDNKAST